MSKNRLKWVPAFGILGLLLVAGCGPQFKFNEAVEGDVKLDGAPLANVRVEFVPQSQPGARPPGSSGFTDDKGHYRLMCENEKPGAVIGKHRVVLLPGRSEEREQDTRVPAPKEAKSAKPAPMVPPSYQIASQSPLDVEVTADRHSYNLDLKR